MESDTVALVSFIVIGFGVFLIFAVLIKWKCKRNKKESTSNNSNNNSNNNVNSVPAWISNISDTNSVIGNEEDDTNGGHTWVYQNPLGENIPYRVPYIVSLHDYFPDDSFNSTYKERNKEVIDVGGLPTYESIFGTTEK